MARMELAPTTRDHEMFRGALPTCTTTINVPFELRFTVGGRWLSTGRNGSVVGIVWARIARVRGKGVQIASIVGGTAARVGDI